ncbi:MAG: hypothetical protein Tsb009_19240 [Planctomycetaceae bacterium]
MSGTKAKPNIRSQQSKRKFLAAFGECGQVSLAAKAAGVARSAHYRWLENDPEYTEQFKEVQEVAAAALEDEARFRALEGLKKYKFTSKGEPVYIRCEADHPEAIQTGEDEQGNPIYMRHYYEEARSDLLLLALLNAHFPERFGKFRHDHKHSGQVEHTGQVQVYLPDNGRQPSQPDRAASHLPHGNQIPSPERN